MPRLCAVLSFSTRACAARSARRCAARSARRCASSEGLFSSLMSPDPLPASESRGALFREGRNALFVVRGATQLALVVSLDIDLLSERAAPAFIERLLGKGDSARGCRGQLPSQAIDDSSEFCVLDAAPDEPPFGRLFGTQLLAQEGESHGTRGTDESWQKPCSTGVGHETQ